MARTPKKYDDDDGRVIVSMDVEGMRWHDKRVRREGRTQRREERALRKAEGAARMVIPADEMSKADARRYAWHAVLAALVIVGVFSLTWVLFILFCTQIWFK